jgi:hypothetical protein
MSYTNNWAKKLKESYIEEKKARQVVDEQVEGSRGPNPKIPVKKVKPSSGNVRRMANKIADSGRAVLRGMGKDAKHLAGIPGAVVGALGRRGGPDEAMHLGKGGMRDHVEHEGNSLQEEVALNEHLLMLIDILCEELGIDVEALLENADPIGRFSSASKGASKGASSSTPDTSERKRKIQDEIAVITHRMSPHGGNPKERDFNTDEFYHLERRRDQLRKELSGLS